MKSQTIWTKTVSLAVLCVLQVAATPPLAPLFDKDLIFREDRSVGSGDAPENTITPENGRLDEALKSITSNTRVLLMQGTYQVDSFFPVMAVSNVTLFGQGDMIITCSRNVGLVFINVTGLTIEGVQIEGCGLSGSNLDSALTQIRQFVDLFLVVYSEMRFAVLLGHCENVVIDNVKVANNSGFGLVGINLIGSSVINRLSAMNNVQPSNCTFLNIDVTTPLRQTFTDPLRYGGGAVFVYQDYTLTYQSVYGSTSNELTITEGTFKDNSECSFNYLHFIRSGDSIFLRDIGYRLGGGGGLTFLVTQINYGLTILTRNTRFDSNSATMGGSAHLALFSGVKNTHIEFSNCTFTRSGGGNLIQNPTAAQLAGAGLGVAIDNPRPDNELVTPPHVAHNLNTTIRVIGSRFTDNVASYGGGLFFYSAYTSAVSDLTDVLYLHIEDCTFERNTAFIGPAMQLMEYKYGAANVGTQLQIKDSNFVNNTVMTTDVSGTQSILQSAGVIDIRYLNASLHGNCRIESNTGTGLRAEVSYIGIAGNVTFRRNVGIRGGGLHLQSYTYLIVLPNASLYLLDNVARVEGGAIFSNFQGLNSYITGGGDDCFLYFNYDTISFCENCSDLNKTGSFIKLQGNSALYGNQIFGSSFQTCAWASDLRFSLQTLVIPSILELITELYPTVIEIDGSLRDPANFRTQAQALVVLPPDLFDPSKSDNPVYDSSTATYNIVPGQTFPVRVTAFDGYIQSVSNVVSSFISTNVSTLFDSASTTIGPNNFGVLQNNNATELPLSINGSQGQNLTVVVYSTDMIGRALGEINVNLGYCANGFVYDNVTRSCVCDLELIRLGISCDTEDQRLRVPDGMWVGPVDDAGLLGVADCSSFFCNHSSEFTEIQIINGQVDFEVQCNGELFRGGILCKQCALGRSFVLGTPRCLECSNAAVLLFPVFLILGVLLTIVIFYLDITISEGLLNGAIFFSNLVVLYALFLFPANYGGSNFIFIISFLTLNFGIESCLYDRMGSLDRLWWQLSFPLYLVVVMVIIVLFARTRYGKVLHKMNRLSAARAFTTLSLLCYVSVLQVCVELLGSSEILTIDGGVRRNWITDASVLYFHNGHIPMLLLSLLLILVYLLPFPFFLLFPSLIFKSKYLRNLKPFYDAYWHPFEPNFRFWLGARLIFRWVPFLLTFLVPSPANIFVTNFLLLALLFVQVTLKPFKSWWVNTIDSFFIFLLILMFTGTLYFVAEIEGVNTTSIERGITTYNQVMTVAAFSLMCALFYYHLYIRFPKVKSFSQKVWHKLSCKKGEYSPPQIEIEQIDGDSTSSPKPTKPKTAPTQTVITISTELREPLLEDGNLVTTNSIPPLFASSSRSTV